MSWLTLHSRKAETIFELLGTHENAMSASIGWALSQSPVFCQKFLRKLEIETNESHE